MWVEGQILSAISEHKRYAIMILKRKRKVRK